MTRKLQPTYFLSNYPQQANPPFCFSCGERKAYCKCKEGPLSKNDWMILQLTANKNAFNSKDL